MSHYHHQETLLEALAIKIGLNLPLDRVTRTLQLSVEEQGVAFF